MSLDQATLDQATFWVALAAALATIVYGEISRRQQNSHHEEQRTLAEEQLQLARARRAAPADAGERVGRISEGSIHRSA